MNRSYKTKAIIIKQYEVGEADRIIKAFSHDLGLITLSARGVRKTLAKLKGHLELFNYSFLILHRSQRGAIDAIIGAETIHPFKKLRSNLKNTSRLYLIAEFLNRVLPEREVHTEIFNLLLYVLKDLENGGQRERRLILNSYFLLRSLKLLGYAPHFRECIRCQSKLKTGGNYFDFNGAGTVCPSCSSGGGQLSDQAIISLRILNETQELNLPLIKISKNILEEVVSLVENYAEYVIESELKSKEFIKRVD